jgi:glycosyltransferase involved in cell wall biosynthesis
MEQHMKIVILGGSPRHFGGVETFCQRAKSALENRSGTHEISWLTTRTAYLSLSRLPGLLRGLAEFARMRLDGRAVVWLQYVNLADLAYLVLGKLLGFRVVVTPHLGTNWRSQQNGALRSLSRTLLGLSDKIALLARTQAEEISLPEHTPRTMIHTFLPAEVLRDVPLRQHDGPLRLLHASRLSEAKGTFLVVDTAGMLSRQGTPFTAQIIGSADDGTMARLRQTISRQGLDDTAELVGFVEPDLLMERLRGADVLIHLSSVDSYPLIMLEALACGVFPIALDLAGARDIVSRFDGHIVSADGAAEQAAAFLASNDPDELRRRARHQAQRVRDAFGWDQAAALLEAALCEPVTQPRHTLGAESLSCLDPS